MLIIYTGSSYLVKVLFKPQGIHGRQQISIFQEMIFRCSQQLLANPYLADHIHYKLIVQSHFRSTNSYMVHRPA